LGENDRCKVQSQNGALENARPSTHRDKITATGIEADTKHTATTQNKNKQETYENKTQENLEKSHMTMKVSMSDLITEKKSVKYH
jgi:hypothetical protein